MNDEIEDVLDAHAAALNRNKEVGDELLTAHPEQADELRPLIQLASALKAVLVPVSAPAFKARLGQELVTYGPPVVALGPSVTKPRAKAWLALAAAGSLISAAGVTALLLHRLRSVDKITAQPATVVQIAADGL